LPLLKFQPSYFHTQRQTFQMRTESMSI